MFGWRAYRYLVTALLLSGSVQAQSLSLSLGADRVGGGKATPALPFATATGLYSFRKLQVNYAGSAIRLRRASDSTQQDIGFTANGDFDITAATSFCNATSCFVAKWYDQAPAAQDFVQASASNQPPFLFACLNGIPCVNLSSNLATLTATSVTQTGVVTFNVVVNRTVGTGICVLPQVSNNAIKTRSGVAGLNVQASIGTITTNSAENTWHSATSGINGASSYFAVDGATTTGSLTGSTNTSTPSISGAASTTCLLAEMGFWQAIALSATDVAALNTNQHTYWGF
jgi:Alpha-L-arabinofuranosidase B, catalytic